MLFVISACNDNDAWCEGSSADSYAEEGIKQVKNSTIKIYSVSAQNPDGDPENYGRWVNSQFSVEEGDVFEISASNTIVIATDYQNETNGGEGKEFIIPANKSTPTPVVDDDGNYFEFAWNQQVTVTSNDCTTGGNSYCTPIDCSTGADDYCISNNGCKPNKWTWGSNWKYRNVDCYQQGSNWEDPAHYTGGIAGIFIEDLDELYLDDLNGAIYGEDSYSDVQCKAQVCTDQTNLWGAKVCWATYSWTCEQKTKYYSDEDQIYKSDEFDVCPRDDITTATTTPYICDTNENVNPDGGCWYPAEEYLPHGDKSWCDGSHGCATETCSDTSPCGGACGTKYNTSDYYYNICGTIDTCWNTGGYRLYATEEGSQCPVGCVDDDPYTDNPCGAGCYHLNGSYATYDETGGDELLEGGDFVGGTSFTMQAVQGGKLYLQIINPLSDPPADADDLTAEYQANEDQIYLNNEEIGRLSGLLSDQLDFIATYNSDMINFGNDALTLNEGIIDDSDEENPVNAPIKDQLTDIQLLFDEPELEYVVLDDNDDPVLDENGDEETDTTNMGIESMFDTLIDDDIPAYNNSLSSDISKIADEMDTSWTVTVDEMDNKTFYDNTVEDLYHIVQDIIDAGNALSTDIYEGDGLTSLDTEAEGCVVTQGDDVTTLDTSAPGCVVTEGDGSTSLNTSAPGCVDEGYWDSGCKCNLVIWSDECYVTSETTYSSDCYVTTSETLYSDECYVVNISETTSEDLQAFKDDLNVTMPDLEYQLWYANDLYNQIMTLNSTNNQLESDNDDLNNEITSLNAYDSDDMVGGYTVFVKGGPLTADNGRYIHAVVSDGDPNIKEDMDDPEITTELFNIGATDADLGTATPYTVGSSGNIWTFIDDPDGRWDNNSQFYNLMLGKVSYSSGFDTLTTGLIEDIQNSVITTSERIFKGVTCSAGEDTPGQCSEYIKIITAMLYLYIIIWGMMYLFGLIRTDRLDFVIRIAKIGAITILIQPGSFEFFQTYLFQAFYDFSNVIVSSATGSPLDNPFRFLNQNMNVLLLDETTYYKLMGLMLQGLIGLVTFCLLIHGVISFIAAFFQAFLVYMMSFIGLGLCFATAPIFIVFLLFNKTKYLFENWFNLMVKFSIQPVLLLIGLIIINGMLSTILDSLFNYYVCFKCTLPITFAIPGYPEVGTVTLFCLSWFSAWGDDNVDTPATQGIMSIPLAIIFCMVTSIMRIYADKLASEVAGEITGSASMPSGGGKHQSMGLNPLKGLDNRMKSIATFTGVAKDEKEYKALRNKGLMGGAKLSAAMTAPVAALGYMAYKRKGKKMDPKSLNKDNTNSSEQDNTPKKKNPFDKK